MSSSSRSLFNFVAAVPSDDVGSDILQMRGPGYNIVDCVVPARKWFARRSAMQKQQRAAKAFIRGWSHIAPSRRTWRGGHQEIGFPCPQVKDLIAAASL